MELKIIVNKGNESVEVLDNETQDPIGSVVSIRIQEDGSTVIIWNDESNVIPG